MVGAKMFAFFAFSFVACTFLSGVMEGHAALAATKLTADITAESTTVAVTNTQDFLSLDDVYIENEKVRYTNKNETTFLNVTRGLDSTDAAPHTRGTMVKNEETNIVNNLLGYNVATSTATYGSVKAMVGLGWNLLKSLPKIIAWDYSFLDGQMAMVKYLLLWPISIGFVFSLGMMFITAIQGIFRL